MRRGGDARRLADADTLIAALDPYGVADRAAAWHGDGALLVQTQRWNTIESQREGVPAICAATGRVLIGAWRIDNRDALLATLPRASREPIDDAQLILAAHRHWGDACAERIEGDFAFAIYDPARHTLFCARDALGVKPCFVHCSDDLLVVAGTAATFPALRGFDTAPSREWLARYLIGESADPATSAYRHVRKLPPAHRLTIGREGAAEPTRFFAFADTAPPASKRDRAYVNAYRDAFHRAVEARLRSAYPIGVENSGGLDSATIIGHASRVLPGGGADLAGFSLCHMEREASPILDLAMHCGLRDNYVLTRPDYQPSDAQYARAIRVLGHPPEHSLVNLYQPFFERCRSAGIRTLLSGFGGDEIVTAQAEFVPRELVYRRQWRNLVDVLPGNLPMRIARAANQVVGSVRGSVDGKLQGATARFADSLLRREVIEEYGLRGFVAAKADAFRGARTLGEHLLTKPAFATLMTGRLEGCTLMAASYGVDYRWPMLDRALIERFLATPSIDKRHRQWGRFLHRRACEGTIPDAILWKPDKNLGGFPHLSRDRRQTTVDPGHLAPALLELIDEDTLARQQQQLQRAIVDAALWKASAAERHNLRGLHMLDLWLSGDDS
ncbi:asparagine synthase-related protein [Sphingomonas baiyangensis]|nr:asparagine synthase-related protein [Sphingomonas baiyangensis]